MTGTSSWQTAGTQTPDRLAELAKDDSPMATTDWQTKPTSSPRLAPQPGLAVRPAGSRLAPVQTPEGLRTLEVRNSVDVLGWWANTLQTTAYDLTERKCGR